MKNSLLTRTVFGWLQKKRTVEGSHTHLAELKKLITQKKYTEAESLVEQKMIKYKHQSLNNRPLCKVNLSFHDNAQSDSYRCALNMQTGISSLKYLKNGVRYQREYFSSFPDQVMAWKFTSNRKNKLSFKLQITGFTPLIFDKSQDTLFFTGEVEKGGTKFASGFKVILDEGSLLIKDNSILIKDCNSANNTHQCRY